MIRNGSGECVTTSDRVVVGGVNSSDNFKLDTFQHNFDNSKISSYERKTFFSIDLQSLEEQIRIGGICL